MRYIPGVSPTCNQPLFVPRSCPRPRRSIATGRQPSASPLQDGKAFLNLATYLNFPIFIDKLLAMGANIGSTDRMIPSQPVPLIVLYSPMHTCAVKCTAPPSHAPPLPGHACFLITYRVECSGAYCAALCGEQRHDGFV